MYSCIQRTCPCQFRCRNSTQLLTLSFASTATVLRPADNAARTPTPDLIQCPRHVDAALQRRRPEAHKLVAHHRMLRLLQRQRRNCVLQTAPQRRRHQQVFHNREAPPRSPARNRIPFVASDFLPPWRIVAVSWQGPFGIGLLCAERVFPVRWCWTRNPGVEFTYIVAIRCSAWIGLFKAVSPALWILGRSGRSCRRTRTGGARSCRLRFGSTVGRRNGRGGRKDIAARSFVRKLSGEGLILLSTARHPGWWSHRRSAAERAGWSGPCRIVGCSPTGSAALRGAARDHWIGLSDATRREGLGLVANRQSSPIVNAVRVPHPASHVLARVARRLGADYEARHGIRFICWNPLRMCRILRGIATERPASMTRGGRRGEAGTAARGFRFRTSGFSAAAAADGAA